MAARLSMDPFPGILGFKLMIDDILFIMTDT